MRGGREEGREGGWREGGGPFVNERAPPVTGTGRSPCPPLKPRLKRRGGEGERGSSFGARFAEQIPRPT